MILAITDEALITVNTLELLGIIYLAVAVAKLGERIARIEGRLNGKRPEETK